MQSILDILCDNLVVIGLTLQNYDTRKMHIQKQFEKHNIQYVLHENQKHQFPIIGCLISHINAIKYAKAQGYDNVMICEDDIFITEKVYTIQSAPPEWDMLYFGGILTEHFTVEGRWIHGRIWCNHAYIVKSHMYDKIIDVFDSLDLNSCREYNQTIDWLFTTYFHSNYKCFLDEQQSIIQKQGMSTLTNTLKWDNWDWNTWTMKVFEQSDHKVHLQGLMDAFNNESITCLRDGPITDIPQQCKIIDHLIAEHHSTRLLEIGFGSGFSSCFFLQCSSMITVDSIEINPDESTRVAKTHIDQLYPNKHNFIVGHSNVILPSLAGTYDLIFIDGSNDMTTRYNDIMLSKHISDNKTILIMDDVVNEPEHSQSWNNGPTHAWNRLVNENVVIELGYVCFQNGRGMTWGKFQYGNM